MAGVRRRIDPHRERRERIVVPSCIRRFESTPYHREQVERYYKDLILRGEHYKAHQFTKDFQRNPDKHVRAWKSFETNKIKKLATTGQYSKGNTEPRYLYMDG